LEFDKDGGILLLSIRLPYLRAFEILKTRELKSGLTIVRANQREVQLITNQLPYLIALRLIWEVPQVDYDNRVGLVACNGYVVYDDPGTGQQRRDIVLTVAAKKEDLKNIKLERIEPEACFRSLKGVAAVKISDLVPVQPLIRFNKEDSRFIAAREVIGTLGDTNLAAMDWQDFEHLIRELFEKEFGGGGAEVKVTQASRDRGVDAIVFDPDPLRGGKFVIQAKRYTNTVDVGAVRDLYGTVVNEGANRGILVTTSNYGIDAYEFAKDKPITLLNGENLLHLLQKHGYYMKIDIKEAKRLLKVE
jgi:restriction system protein